ncbi:hypothetical protein IE53DRAFT_391330 [Violaceomyces palustris]|uniref:Uncharacterized protein n=1 Tax=Violaceomyces palustris TaxID=1673888 RepID=A0ACD0NKX9_9BASI|nr:hypothetical protein IE53DRAFT_391330 [Violaceomyces palustris]
MVSAQIGVQFPGREPIFSPSLLNHPVYPYVPSLRHPEQIQINPPSHTSYLP